MGNAGGSGDVLVVGAGIVGASVAYHAARAGAAVKLVDTGAPGAAVTSDSFAWVRAFGNLTGPAAQLRASATQEYRCIQAELPGLPVTWSGSLTWSSDDDPPQVAPGQQIVDAAIAATLEPHLRHPRPWAVWTPGDGAVDPLEVSEQLVAAARAHGAQLHLDTAVTALHRDGTGRIVGVETRAGPMPATTVVLAAGVATPALAAPLGVTVPIEASPCPLVRLRAPADLVRTVLSTENFDLRQASADHLVAATLSPERTSAAVASTFRGAERVNVLGTRVGVRPMPTDGEPIIGPVPDVPGLYLAVMHAAVMLAPTVGRLVAREIVDGVTESALTGCRPDRF